jgi:Cytochrome oxidase complex assembly protein 1
MTMPPYPLVPQPTEKGWFDRHPAWKIPIAGFVLILFVGAFVALLLLIVEGSLHHSELFAQAVAKAGENMQVRNELGAPLKAAWLISGNLSVSGSCGSAELSIPIAGPRRKGIIHVSAVKSAGTWQFKQLVVNVENQAEGIDLLVVEPTSMQEF